MVHFTINNVHENEHAPHFDRGHGDPHPAELAKRRAFSAAGCCLCSGICALQKDTLLRPGTKQTLVQNGDRCIGLCVIAINANMAKINNKTARLQPSKRDLKHLY